MTITQSDLAFAAVVKDEHPQPRCGNCINGACNEAPWPCLPYRLAALALDLQGKVARVEAALLQGGQSPEINWRAAIEALADPTPAALCPKVSPLDALTDRTCAKPAGHAGPCLFAGHDGRTDLEVMPK